MGPAGVLDKFSHLSNICYTHDTLSTFEISINSSVVAGGVCTLECVSECLVELLFSPHDRPETVSE